MVLSPSQKILNLDSLIRIRSEYKSLGKTVIWTNGCFDLLHVGHTRGFYVAKQKGDVLFVGINSDTSVRQLKGEGRPIMSDSHRAELIASLEIVDYVTIFNELSSEIIISKLQPDVYCKGYEYFSKWDNSYEQEANLVKSYGGKIEYLPLVPEISTSILISRIQATGK